MAALQHPLNRESEAGLSPSPERARLPMSASPGGRGAAGERCSGLPCAHSLPTRGREGQRPALRSPGWSGAGSSSASQHQPVPGWPPPGVGTRRGPAGAASRGGDNAAALPEHPRGAFVPAWGGGPAGPLPRGAVGAQPRGSSILPGAGGATGAREHRGAAADKARRQAGTPSIPSIPSPRRRSRQPRIPRQRQGPALPWPLPRGPPTCSEESIHLGVRDSAFLRRPFGGIHGWGRGGGEPGGW